jgi:hypothetical protein
MFHHFERVVEIMIEGGDRALAVKQMIHIFAGAEKDIFFTIHVGSSIMPVQADDLNESTITVLESQMTKTCL